MLEPLIAVGETADAAEEGLKVITGMLVVGLIFASVVVFGELIHWLRIRRHRRREAAAADVNTWRTIT
jgi:hypothetical protein